MQRHNDSHLDHGLSSAQIEFLLKIEVPEGEVTVKTVELPEELGKVPCGLHGPEMGDAAVMEADVTYAVRGERKGASRLVARPTRKTSKVTFVAGPHDGQEGVIFTAFGGPMAPRELFECDDMSSREFWATHALSSEEDGS